jgi:3-methyladenine DNA glycosylase AlkD
VAHASPSISARVLVQAAQRALRSAAVPADAEPMQRYMKTDMPFYGVRSPARARILRTLPKAATADEYVAGVEALWRLPHREEKYLAIDYAGRHRAFLLPAHLPLYERLIREGAWWDLVDATVGVCLSPAYLRHRSAVQPIMRAWIDDDDRWIRRAALLAQLKHKDALDEAELFDFCRRRAHEKEFFIRKAIGWALREHAKRRPEAVRRFLAEEGERLSGLSRREAAKHL